MPTPSIITQTVFEGAGAKCMARVVGNDAANITQASVTSISRQTFRGSTSVDTSALTVSSVVFDTLQTDATWSEDSTGYNFATTVPASVLADGGKVYMVECTFTMASGEPLVVVFGLTTMNVRTS